MMKIMEMEEMMEEFEMMEMEMLEAMMEIMERAGQTDGQLSAGMDGCWGNRWVWGPPTIELGSERCPHPHQPPRCPRAPFTSMSSLSPSSFFPLSLATLRSSRSACWGLPAITSQRADSVTHLRTWAAAGPPGPASVVPTGTAPGWGSANRPTF